MSKAVRTTIQISGIELEVFKVADNGNDDDYVMSQRQVAKAIDVWERNVRHFLARKQSESSQGKDYRYANFSFDDEKPGRRGGNGGIKPMPIKLASEFWATQAFKGNELAQALTYACMLETLKRRCDDAFGKQKTNQEYEQENIADRQSWYESRQFLKDSHASFMNCCNYNGFNGAIAHDLITTEITGKTAKELRFDELVDGNYRVGLNHIEDANSLIKIAQVKLAFSRYKKGTVKQRVQRALSEVLEGKK